MESIGWLVVVNFALYLKTLRFKFVSDDITAMQNPPIAKNIWHKWWLRFSGQLKKLSMSVHFLSGKSILEKRRTSRTFKADKWYMILAKTEEFDHFLTLLIHTAICLSIYFAFGRNSVSFVAAMLYGVNPINNQGTIWPSGRGYALPILSLLLCFSLPWFSPALLYFCSWYTIGFLAPLTLIGSKIWYALAFMPFIWWIHSRKYTKAIKFKHTTEAFDADKEFGWHKFVIFFKTYGYYLFLCLVPFRVTFYHNFLQSMAGNDIMRRRARSMDRYFWLGIAAFFGTLIYAGTNWGPLAWAFLAFLIGIAPYCNFIRANQEIAERFTCLPNVFLMYALAQLIAAHPMIVSAVLAFYATRTFYTLSMYKDEYNITEIAVIEDPEAWWAWHSRAMKRWQVGSYHEALSLWVRANMISPKEFKLLINIATCLRMIGNNKEADEYLARAEANIIAGQEDDSRKFIDAHRKGELPILL